MVAALVSMIGEQKFEDVSCGFRAYNREALLRLNVFEKFTYTHQSILSLVYQGLRVIEMPISIRYYPDRRSRVAGSISNYANKTSKIILRVPVGITGPCAFLVHSVQFFSFLEFFSRLLYSFTISSTALLHPTKLPDLSGLD